MIFRSVYAKAKAIKMKFCILTVMLLSVYLFVFYIILMEVQSTHQYRSGQTSTVVIPYVVVHLDLKGAPPKLSYLEYLMPSLKELGVNGLLMEYEDMFPYTGQLENISASNSYKRTELRNFLSKAVTAGFEIIPLIQTFGHMEHVLKLEEFQHLREVPVYPDSICPSKVDSINVISQMLEQIIKFHNDIHQLKYIHIGCDEVYHMNKCYECKLRGANNIHLYFDHLQTITEIVNRASPDTKILIWDDMLRGIKPAKLKEMDHFNSVNPVYWDYQPYPIISNIDLMNYHNKFNDIWIATAFKGADGRTASIPNVKDRFFNHYNWLNFIMDYKFGGEKNVYSFKGIVLTGWSRYSHMDPLCELLPVSMPSLIINLMLIRKFQTRIVVNDNSNDLEFLKEFLNNEFKKKLKCNVDVNTEDFSFCKFESRDLYILVKEFDNVIKNIEGIFYGDEYGLYTVEYYSKNYDVNMNIVEHHIQLCDKNIKKINDLERKLNETLSKYYDKYFIEEYLNSKTYSIKKRLNNVMDFLNTYWKNHTWKRRIVNNFSLI